MNTELPSIEWSLYWYDFIHDYDVSPSTLSISHHTTVELIRSLPTVKWDFYQLCNNDSIIAYSSFEVILSIYELCYNEHINDNIQYQHFIQYIQRCYMERTTLLDLPLLLNDKYILEMKGIEISRNPHYTLDDWKNRITEPFEKNYPYEKGKWGFSLRKYLENPAITWGDILYIHRWFPTLIYEGGVGYQSCITWPILKENPDFPFDWYDVSRNPNITMKIVRENPEMEWDAEGLSCNPSICWADIVFHPEYEWSPTEVSRNPSITMEIVKENTSYPWNYMVLACNKMTVSRDAFYEEKRRRKIFREEIFPEYASIVLRPSKGIYGRLMELGLLEGGGDWYINIKLK